MITATTPEQQRNIDAAQAIDASKGACFSKFAACNPNAVLTNEERQRSIATAEARHHAATSTGPTTLQGKLRSSLNARKHGYSGASLVIDPQDQPAYDAHLAAYHRAFKPQNQPQADAVRVIANAAWRSDRLTVIEACLIEMETNWNAIYTDAKIAELTRAHHLAIGFMQHTDSSSALNLCRRYHSAAIRDQQKATEMFERLKQLTEPVAAAEDAREEEEVPAATNKQAHKPAPNELPPAARKPATVATENTSPTANPPCREGKN